jgi:murein DD-endopeptidase MepM/ murein hydrolase activator NlpD
MHVYRAVVPMAFPFAPNVDYRYVPNFYENRGGRARDYNHVKRVLADGTHQRAHDGVDIFVARGTPVRAVFDGVIVDPAVRWRPWNPARYGTTAVVVSTETISPGYAALYMHLDRIDVKPGDRVRRGEVIGAAGSTGNAIGSPLHLHFELRSPFRFEVRQAGLRRLIDAFDPYPSLVAADPNVEGD